ncbi:MAG: carbohydrate-binding family 9-like protein [Treponema sp.]|nr:carbohydrate-binding family 9-like protein [Treponema sp.]
MVLIGVAGTVFAGTYDVVNREEAVFVLDGVADERVWDRVPAIGNFVLPWEDDVAPATVFKAYHDADNLYFSFVLEDEDIVSAEEVEDEAGVDSLDAVHLFFASHQIDRPREGELPPYYVVSLDALGHVHDYSVVYYLRDQDNDWAFTDQQVAGRIFDDRYSVEGVIPLESFRELGLLSDDNETSFLVGLFRSDWSTDGEEPRWISWIDDLASVTETPDIHLAASFGRFRLAP